MFAAGLAITACTTESTLGPIGTPTPGAVDGATPARATQEGQQTDIECPTVTVRTGAATHQIPAGASATNVRYQGSLGQLARECAILGDVMTMRVGVEGRLLVGPKGGPGTVDVPIRIALVAEGPQPKPVWSKFYSVPVGVPEGASQAIFSQVEDDLTFPLPADKKLDNYIVYVGFDPQGAAAAAKAKAPKAAPKPKPKPAATSAAKPAPAKQPAAAAASAPAKQQPQFEPPPSPPPGVFAPPPGHN
ncbi:MAG: hypothetical protein IT539_10080 [Bradyrhizobiaceae bacterium]|nr:hypothetical protein [Bradyrhizobiaceae bacterium]